MGETKLGSDTGSRAGSDLPHIDVTERGAPLDGQPQLLDERLFMQLLVFGCCGDKDPAVVVATLARALEAAQIESVVYEGVNDPQSVAVLTWSSDPSHFVQRVRSTLNRIDGSVMALRPELTMLGRTYSSGHEDRLRYWMLERPRETVLNAAWPWAIWYPLRRSGAFAQLSPKEQGALLREHGTIGRAYGAQDLAHDVRLACHGLDAHDNDFVIGLIGKDLHPLSHVVQTMRKTRQTSEFICRMGPFFVGHVATRTPRSAG